MCPGSPQCLFTGKHATRAVSRRGQKGELAPFTMSSPIPLPLTGSAILGTHSRKRLTAVQDYLPGPMHVQSVDALAGAKIDRDQRTYMRSLLAAVPVGTRGSEWDRAHSASAHSSSQRTALLRGGSLQPLASSGGGTASRSNPSGARRLSGAGSITSSTLGAADAGSEASSAGDTAAGC